MNRLEQHSRRKWRTWLDITLEHPDNVLSRHIAWERGRKDVATATYPEPLNLVAAAAYRKLPKLEDYALLYRDPDTQLWVKVVDVRQLDIDRAEEWIEQQVAAGAVAVWKNLGALPLRPPPVSKFKWEDGNQEEPEPDEDI